MTTQVSFSSRLPVEVITEIIAYAAATGDDYKRIRLVNKLFYSIASNPLLALRCLRRWLMEDDDVEMWHWPRRPLVTFYTMSLTEHGWMLAISGFLDTLLSASKTLLTYYYWYKVKLRLEAMKDRSGMAASGDLVSWTCIHLPRFLTYVEVDYNRVMDNFYEVIDRGCDELRETVETYGIPIEAHEERDLYIYPYGEDYDSDDEHAQNSEMFWTVYGPHLQPEEAVECLFQCILYNDDLEHEHRKNAVRWVWNRISEPVRLELERKDGSFFRYYRKSLVFHGHRDVALKKEILEGIFPSDIAFPSTNQELWEDAILVLIESGERAFAMFLELNPTLEPTDLGQFHAPELSVFWKHLKKCSEKVRGRALDMLLGPCSSAGWVEDHIARSYRRLGIEGDL